MLSLFYTLTDRCRTHVFMEPLPSNEFTRHNIFFFISTTYINKFSIYLCSNFIFGLLRLPLASLIRIMA
jgi:hypothetical protein